jgi:hypothetical protein
MQDYLPVETRGGKKPKYDRDWLLAVRIDFFSKKE